MFIYRAGEKISEVIRGLFHKTVSRLEKLVLIKRKTNRALKMCALYDESGNREYGDWYNEEVCEYNKLKYWFMRSLPELGVLKSDTNKKILDKHL